MSTNYSENIFQSIDTIISQKLNEVSFDRTIVGTIIKKYKDSNTKYLVSSNGLKFDAYAQDDKEYLEQIDVYILIPDGDYSKNKLIIGRYGAEDDLPKDLYTNPFESLVYKSKYSFENIGPINAWKDSTVSSTSKNIDGITFYKNGISDFNYIGIEFSMEVQGLETATVGEYYIGLDLCDNAGKSLLSENLKSILHFSSKQLYGNPYNLTSVLQFQHLFPFPIKYGDEIFNDISQVKQIKVTLVSRGNFNYKPINEDDNEVAKIKLSKINVYFGFDSKQETINKDTLSLYLADNINLEYHSVNPESKTMYIDWRKSNTDVIYTGTEETGNQYPQSGKFFVYWLQYSAKNGYTKKLEPNGIDIEESGTYWKTVKKSDASLTSAYSYTINNLDYKLREEQIKVIIKGEGSYIESNILTFKNVDYESAIGSNEGKQDTLRLTLTATGDDGVYNDYGIDNKILSSRNPKHTLRVTYIDNPNRWEPNYQTVIWKIPKNATMLTPFKIQSGDEQIDDPTWIAEEDNNFYYCENLQEITFSRSEQFGYNKTNNTISCHITRYLDTNKTTELDSYEGSITLQFGTQGTSGSGYAFNIRPNRYGALTNNKSITFKVYLEDNAGNEVSFTPNNVIWHIMQGNENNLAKSNRSETNNGNTYYPTWERTGDSITISSENRNGDNYIKDTQNNAYYNILVATLPDITDTSGKKVNLKAYYPIPYSVLPAAANYHMGGASRIVYNYQGTTPNCDASPYNLYGANNVAIENLNWHIRFPGWSSEGEETQEGLWGNYPALEEVEGGKKLKPLSSLQTKTKTCNITAYNSNNNIVWAQPLLIIHNSYAFPLLNSWDGNLTIDEEGNYILTELIGAGTKNDANEYTGVLMGSIGKAGEEATTGLYGFKDGELRYKLDEKGSFYVGSGSDNYISFNEGNSLSATNQLKIKTNKFDLDTDKLSISNNNGIMLKDSNANTTIHLQNNGTAMLGGWNLGTASSSTGFNIKNSVNIFIGDSYGVTAYKDVGAGALEPYDGGWRSRLGQLIWGSDYDYTISGDHNCWTWADGGAGFVNQSNHDKKTFGDAISQLLGELTKQKKTPKNIIIGGGYNDNAKDYDDIKTKICNIDTNIKDKNFSSRVNVIFFAMGHHKSDTTIQTNLRNIYSKLPGLFATLNKDNDHCKWYLYDIHTLWTYYNADGIHPTTKGSTEIASLMNACLTRVTSGYLYNDNGQSLFQLDNRPSATWAIQIGPPDADFTNVGGLAGYRRFLVSRTGELWATGAHIAGNIWADSGYFKGKIDIDGGATIAGKIKADNIEVSDVIKVGKTDITTITNDTIKTTNVIAENLEIRAANIKDKITANQIEANALTVDSISANKITNGSTNATIGFTGNVTISNNLTVSGIGKIAGINIGTEGLSANSTTTYEPTGELRILLSYRGNFSRTGYLTGWGNSGSWMNDFYTIKANTTHFSVTLRQGEELWLLEKIPSGDGQITNYKRYISSVTYESLDNSKYKYYVFNRKDPNITVQFLKGYQEIMVDSGFIISNSGKIEASNINITGQSTIADWTIGTGYTFEDVYADSSQQVEATFSGLTISDTVYESNKLISYSVALTSYGIIATRGNSSKHISWSKIVTGSGWNDGWDEWN